MQSGHQFEVLHCNYNGAIGPKIRFSCNYCLLTGASYWPETNASELHCARSFQGHPTWPYLARSNMRTNMPNMAIMLKIFVCHFLTKLHPFFNYEGGKIEKKVFLDLIWYDKKIQSRGSRGGPLGLPSMVAGGQQGSVMGFLMVRGNTRIPRGPKKKRK